MQSGSPALGSSMSKPTAGHFPFPISRPTLLQQLGTLGDLLENPVRDRELRSRMRGGRTYWITGGYATAVSVFVLFLYGWLPHQYQGVEMKAAAPGIAQSLWVWGCALQAVLLSFFVPAFTAGSIAREREREMLDLLFLTRLSALRICYGKLAAGVGHGFILFLASLPPLALSFTLGSVSPVQVIQSTAVLATCVCFAGALGLCLSCIAPRTVTASTWAYLLLGFGLVGLPLVLVHFASGPWTSQVSDAEIAGMIIACLAGTFPLAVLLGGIGLRVREGWKERETGKECSATRADWLLFCGFSWCVTALSLWLPGMSELVQSGRYLLVLHPITVLLSTSPGPQSTGVDPLQGLVFCGMASASSVRSSPTMIQLLPDWLREPVDSLFWTLGDIANYTGWNSLGDHLWWIYCIIFLGAAAWLFLITAMRVKRLREG